MSARLKKQIDFLMEIDRLKGVLRRSYLADGSRLENSAEHSWHLAAAALLFSEYAETGVDRERAVKMALIHDIIEIDAGDVFLYDEAATAAKAVRERAAAERIFGMLPMDQRDAMRALWDEFEDNTTPTAHFARGLDRLLPLLHNYFTEGRTWREHGVRAAQVYKMNAVIEGASPVLWNFARGLIEDAVEKGYLAP
mgnify:CR=1 FL=1